MILECDVETREMQPITQAELDARARERAMDERLHTFKISGEPIYMVRSRHTEPGSYHRVEVDGDRVVECTCLGWYYRASCTHAQAVLRRLERERRRRPAMTPASEPRAAA
jgi:hypothetical protein